MWFRQDLRIHDNPALVEAAKWAQRRGGSVVSVYVHSPSEDGDAVGTGSRWAGCFYWGGGGDTILSGGFDTSG
jgi:deoxyribodipyrimidine photolyase